MSTSDGCGSETRLLFQAGREERPDAIFAERLLRALRQEVNGPVRRGKAGFGLSMRLLGVPVALAVAACCAVLLKGASIVEVGLHSDKPAVVPEPLAAPSKRQVPPVYTALPADTAVSQRPARETPAPVVHPVTEPMTRAAPSSAELAAQQRLEREQRERRAAAARASQASSACAPAPCRVVRPSNALIVDFEDVSSEGVFVDGDAYSSKPPTWWLEFYGSPYVYPNSDLTQTVEGSWRIQGRIVSDSGFGLWLGACVADFSQYRGVEFELWGRVGTKGALTMHVDTDANSPPEHCRTNVGHCQPEVGPCVSPSKRLAVPERPGVKTIVLWEELTGGRPRASPEPAHILQLRWSFEPPEPGTESYPVEISVDDVRLVP